MITASNQPRESQVSTSTNLLEQARELGAGHEAGDKAGPERGPHHAASPETGTSSRPLPNSNPLGDANTNSKAPLVGALLFVSQCNRMRTRGVRQICREQI